MGTKVHPNGFRLGIYRDWNAQWFARKGQQYGSMALEDISIRRAIQKQFSRAEIGAIDIQKAGDSLKVIINSARPGVVIGKGGHEIEALRKKLLALTKRGSLEVSVNEVRQPELNAQIVAQSIAEQLTERVSYKKAMKRASSTVMKAGARGVKIRCAGRLGGAEIARKEWVRLGSVRLQTLREDIDYGYAEALTTYGIIGVKVWISRGSYKVNER